MSATQATINEAYGRAVAGQSVMNYAAIYEGFLAKGIPESEIKPRENVFTFWAWKAVGRRVKKGEHGVKACTFIPVGESVDDKTGERKAGFRIPRTTTVFHISQTEPETEQREQVKAETFQSEPLVKQSTRKDGPCKVCGFGTIKNEICSFCGGAK